MVAPPSQTINSRRFGCLSDRQLGFAVVTGIGEYVDSIGPENRHGRDALTAELLAVVASVGYLLVGNELVIVIDRALDAVANGLKTRGDFSGVLGDLKGYNRAKSYSPLRSQGFQP